MDTAIHDNAATDEHTLFPETSLTATEAWLVQRAASYVLSGVMASTGIGWVIENRDGSVLLAKVGDTLSFDGERITRR